MVQEKDTAKSMRSYNLEFEKERKESIIVYDQPLILPITQRQMLLLIGLFLLTIIIISALVYTWTIW